MSRVVPDLNYADIKEVECALPAQPELSCRYQIRIGGKVLVTAREVEGRRRREEGGQNLNVWSLRLSLHPIMRI